MPEKGKGNPPKKEKKCGKNKNYATCSWIFALMGLDALDWIGWVNDF